MNSLSTSNLTAIAARPQALARLKIKIESCESHEQSPSTPKVSQQNSTHMMPGSPPFDAPEMSHTSDFQPPPLTVQSNFLSNQFSEDLLKSFQYAPLPSPLTPNIAKGSPEEPVTTVGCKRPLIPKALLDSLNSKSPLQRLSSPSSRVNLPPSLLQGPPFISPTSDIPSSPPPFSPIIDNGSMFGDNAMATTTSLSQQLIAHSKSPSPSSEEIQVRLLQAKVDKAAAAERSLKDKAGGIWREKQEYDNLSADLNKDLDSTKAEIKDLWAARKKAEDAVRRNRDRQNEIAQEKHLIDKKSHAKWEEGKAAKRDVDVAARNLRSLEKQLREAKVQEELFRLYPDAGLRAFAQNALHNREQSQLFNNLVRGAGGDGVLNAIEKLLEEAEDGAKEDIKDEDQTIRSESADTAREESVMKAESVKIKTEYDTPAPTLPQGSSSSSSAQGLLEAVRQMKACKKSLQVELQKIDFLKRKHQQGDNDSDGSRPPAKRAKSVRYAMETDTESDGPSDHDEGASVDASETEDDG